MNDFDTKDNPIIVLKSNDYNKMKYKNLNESLEELTIKSIEVIGNE